MALLNRMAARARITVERERLAALCRRYHIRRLALFGSVLRPDFGPESDVDVVVAFEPGQVPGFGFVDVQAALSGLFGRRVDLHTPSSLSKYFRDRVLADAEVLFDARDAAADAAGEAGAKAEAAGRWHAAGA